MANLPKHSHTHSLMSWHGDPLFLRRLLIGFFGMQSSCPRFWCWNVRLAMA